MNLAKERVEKNRRGKQRRNDNACQFFNQRVKHFGGGNGGRKRFNAAHTTTATTTKIEREKGDSTEFAKQEYHVYRKENT